MATERRASSARREISIARVVFPVPELPKNHMPRPSPRFSSRCSQKSRTRLTTKASICVTVRRADVLHRRALTGRLLDRLLPTAGPVGELGVVLKEDHVDGSDWAVPVLREDQLGPAGILGLGVVIVVAVEEADEVGVLLDRARLT